MMKLDSTQALLKEEIESYQETVTRVHKMIHEKTGPGNDFLGWVDWAETYDKEEFERIIQVAEKLKDKTNCVVVCGIGYVSGQRQGSCLCRKHLLQHIHFSGAQPY